MKKLLFFLICFLIIISQNGFTGELAPDEHTLLLLHFNDNFQGTNGETPTVATGIIFEQGLFGNGCRIHKSDSPYFGDSLYYQIPQNFDPAQGTIEFWLKPRWIGKEFYVMQAFNLGEVRIQFNIPGILGFFMLTPDNEIGYLNVENWTENEWHHIAATWKIPGRMKLFVDGVERSNSPATELDLLDIVPDIMKIGGVFPSENVEAVIDEFRLSSIERSPQEIAQSVMAGDFSISNISLSLDSVRLQKTWEFTPEIKATTNIGVANLPNSVATWTVTDTTIAQVNELGTIVGISSGATELTIEYDSFLLEAFVKVDKIHYEPETVPIDSFLATPAEGNIWEIPVVIIQFFPTLDSTYIEWENPSEKVPLEEIKLRAKMFSRRIKFAVEEGSRYHGYQDSTALPSLGYRVIEILNIYEHMPMSDNICWWNPGNHYPDYQKVFQRINAEHYVNDLGVKEFWIWYCGFEINGIGYELPESNMSSPITGDVSNSERNNNDMPVYDHSYITYIFGWHLNHAYAIHNIGHQIESMLSFANEKQDGNNDLFIHKFCGMDSTDTWVAGRCGWTHMPPNTNLDYHYDDTTLVWSDCEDWTPDNSGEKKLVNVDTWLNIAYPWPSEPTGWIPDHSPYHLNWQRADAHFYIYWRQNIPGYQNNIQFDGNKTITNWWQFLGNWDNAIQNNKGLYFCTPTDVKDEKDPEIITKFQLFQNYPNPFNSITTIKYQLPGKSDVKIVIHNMLGQNVITLVDEKKMAGNYSLKWNGLNQAGEKVGTGLYFLTLSARADSRNYTKTNKLLLLE